MLLSPRHDISPLVFNSSEGSLSPLTPHISSGQTCPPQSLMGWHSVREVREAMPRVVLVGQNIFQLRTLGELKVEAIES
jgi:hypothetical protein